MEQNEPAQCGAPQAAQEGATSVLNPFEHFQLTYSVSPSECTFIKVNGQLKAQIKCYLIANGRGKIKILPIP